MSEPKISETVQKELDRVNKVWNNLLSNLHDKSNEGRIKSILVQVMMEYYIDRILKIIDTSLNLKDIRYDLKLTYLIEKKIINVDMKNDLLIIYEIRNNYAHEIEIYPKKILNLLNKIKEIKDVTRFTENERIDKVTEIILRGVQRTFMEILVHEQKRLDNVLRDTSMTSS